MARLSADGFLYRSERNQPLQMARETFANPIYDGADPWVVRHDDVYYSCNTGPGGRIEIWKSDSLIDRGECTVVWAPPRLGWNRGEVWAPELHFIRGNWYIYYAASDGKNATHRMGVLRSQGEDACGPFEDLGQMYTGDHLETRTENRWGIDGTVLELNDQLYFIWSGWEDHRDVQYLYIAEMSDPATISSNRVKICANDSHTWERVGHDNTQRGLNEGPAILHRNGRVLLVYSCSGSWQATYKLGLLTLSANSNPMDPASWTKHPRPIFDSSLHVFGVGHCSFTTSSDGREDWILFHAKKSKSEGWDRHVFAQPFSWGVNGLPNFGQPMAAGQEMAAPGARPSRQRAA